VPIENGAGVSFSHEVKFAPFRCYSTMELRLQIDFPVNEKAGVNRRSPFWFTQTRRKITALTP
jgi:hypothetical protein